MTISLPVLPEESLGPRATKSLLARGSSLASPSSQVERLEAVRVPGVSTHFGEALARRGLAPLRTQELEIFQMNLGKLCNMTCRHCHVDAGPDRYEEVMTWSTMEACLDALGKTSAHTVDLTGGAPELNPHFRPLVDELVARGKHVIDRCNLTVLLTGPGADLPQWLGDRGVEVVCSLPHHARRNTDLQRGDGTFERSIEALVRLNAAGYGQGDPSRRLTIMTNASGAFILSDHQEQEREWRNRLRDRYGITFDRLIALNNMPIARFLEWLVDTNGLDRYVGTLVRAFNAATVSGLMCRNTLSISWDGYLYDCDFNQMLDMKVEAHGRPVHITDFDFEAMSAREIKTNVHCFGCTAGAGSSCGGAIAR